MGDLRRELLARMREIRSRVDPEVMERARLAALGKVPYDREAARSIVGRFLESRDDGGAFRRKLEEALRAEGADAAALLSPPEPSGDGTPGPKRPRWRRIGRII